MIDRYTKAILTVIAVSLTVIAFRGIAVERAAISKTVSNTASVGGLFILHRDRRPCDAQTPWSFLGFAPIAPLA